jgi:hypothetical protein
MNYYSLLEIEHLVEDLDVLIITSSPKVDCFGLTCNSIKKCIVQSTFSYMFTHGGKFSMGLRDKSINYFDPTLYLSESDIKDIGDFIFLEKLNNVPLFINVYPEIATWRLRIGK